MGRGARRGAGSLGDRRGGLTNLRIIAVGRARGPERDLFDRYASRFRPPLALTEIPDGIGSPVEIMRREASALLAAVPPRSLLVVLDEAGEMLSSAALAAALDRWIGTGRDSAFVIGGAEGLDTAVRDRADIALSLGPQTWPHLLARVMLAEQLYRARTILDGHPYHRSGRPRARSR